MKRFLFLFVFCLCSVLYTLAQIQYAVTSNTPLAVHSKTDPNSKILGKINKGSAVDVYEVSRTTGVNWNWKEYWWATIKYNGKTAYVDFKSLTLSQTTLKQINHLKKTKRRVLYKVTSSKPLDVTTRAGILIDGRKGVVYPGDTVEVYSIEITTDEAQAEIRFKGRKRYINAFGIQPCQDTRRKEFAPLDIDTERGAIANLHWMFFIILILWIACAVCVLTFDKLSKHFENANMIVFFIASVLEIIYVLVMWNESLSFFDNMPYLLRLVLFLAFIAIIILNIIDFKFALDTADHFTDTDIRLGLASWIIFILTTALYTIFSWEKGYTIAIAVFALCQLIQLFIIFKTLVPSLGLARTLWYVALYLIGSIAVAIISTLATIVLVGLFLYLFVILKFFDGPVSGSSKSSSGKATGSLRDSSGKIIYGEFDNDYDYFEGEGYKFRRDGNKWKEYH